MFQVPALLSCVLDTLFVSAYLLNPETFGDSYSNTWWQLLNLHRSFLLMVILAAVRVCLLVPQVRQFKKNKRMPNSLFIHGFLLISVIVVVIKASMTSLQLNAIQAFALIASLVSIICQVVCLRHLKSSVVPVRHVLLGMDLHSLSLRRDMPQGCTAACAGGGAHVAFDLQDLSSASLSNIESGNFETSQLLSASYQHSQEVMPATTVSADDEHVFRNKLAVARRVWRAKIDEIKDLLGKLGLPSRSHNSAAEAAATGPKRQNRSLSDSSMAGKDAFDLLLQLYLGDGKGPDSVSAVEHLEWLSGRDSRAMEFYLPQIAVYLLYGSFGGLGERLKQAVLRVCELSLPFALKLHWFVAAFCLSEAGVASDGVYTLMALNAEVEAAGEAAAQKVFDSARPSGSSGCNKRRARGWSPGETQYENGDGSGDVSASGEGPAANCSGYPMSEVRLPALGTSHVSQSLQFWHDVVEVSRTLGAAPREHRQTLLRQLIASTAAHYLPSATIHVPFRNAQHRMWAVHADECFAFSSVDRAPVLLCIEVLFYGAEQKSDRAKVESDRRWWLPSLLMSRPATAAAKESKSPREASAAADGDSAECTPIIPAMKLGDQQQVGYSGDGRSGPLGGVCTPTSKSYTAAGGDMGQWTSPGLALRASMGGKRHSEAQHRPTEPIPPRDLTNDMDLEGAGSEGSESSSPQAYQQVAQSAPNSGCWRPVVSAAPAPTPELMLSKDLDADVELSGLSGGGRLADLSYNSCRSYGGGEEDENGDEYLGDNSVETSVVFKERWRCKEARIRQSSAIGHLDGWRLVPVIVKSNDDLRQEQCAAQLISLMHDVLQGNRRCGSGLRPYEILAMSPDSGLIEAVPDTVSLHALRAREDGYASLLDFFEQFFGPQDSPAFQSAQRRFIKSLADYSIVCYLLQIKDRHNGNMLLTTRGAIIHIDFGFLLGRTPGDVGFEKAPFKLTREFVQVMGGEHSAAFHKFRRTCVQSFMELRKHHSRVVLLLEMISKGSEHLRCFDGDAKRVIDEMRQRFCPDMHDNAAADAVQKLIDDSLDNWTTNWYDKYQKCFVSVF